MRSPGGGSSGWPRPRAQRAAGGCASARSATARRRWRSLSVYARRRLVAVARASRSRSWSSSPLAVPNLPCQFPGGDGCPPADDAERARPGRRARLPARRTSTRTPTQYEAAADVADAVPAAQRTAARAGAARCSRARRRRPPTSSDDVRPWFGGEAALAVARRRRPARRAASSCSRSTTPSAAAEYAGSLPAARRDTDEYDGVEVTERRARARDRAGRRLPGDRHRRRRPRR